MSGMAHLPSQGVNGRQQGMSGLQQLQAHVPSQMGMSGVGLQGHVGGHGHDNEEDAVGDVDAYPLEGIDGR